MAVGAQDPGAGAPEAGEDVRRRVAVRVAGAGGDQGEGGTDGVEETGRGGRAAAVVGDLEHARGEGARRVAEQGPLPHRLHVTGQEDAVPEDPGGEDHRSVVVALAG